MSHCTINGINCDYATNLGFCSCSVCCNPNLVANTIKKEEQNTNWHTGTPTEEGDYLVAVKYEPVIGVEYQVNRYLLEPYNSFIYKLAGEGGRIIAWQKIEPYKETDNE